MVQKAIIALGTLVAAFGLTIGVVMAQTATPSPTMSPSPTASPQVPSAAPATGMAVR
ncbi:hypothetical protein M1437_03335 [Patescibacteria group bacterium]|nr:hypothetical protein [Patescibacteria group bacterium]